MCYVHAFLACVGHTGKWPGYETRVCSLSFHRFTAEEKAKRHPCAYLPFGLGPRNCVGMRFALMEAKMALVEIVRNFKILRLPETKVRIHLQLHASQ